MHQSRMKPLKPFSRWTRNTSSLPEIIRFFSPLLYPQIFPYLPPPSLPPTSHLLPPTYLPPPTSPLPPLHRSWAVIAIAWAEWARTKWVAAEWTTIGTEWASTRTKWAAIGAEWATTWPQVVWAHALEANRAWNLKLARSNLELQSAWSGTQARPKRDLERGA
jgi:hypothetical protein